MPWHASLRLDYQREGHRCVARFQHEGPLRILQSLYPEGDAVCHNVLVHPPSGLVGGDVLDIAVEVGPAAHALITTPGATRFYRSLGEAAVQQTRLRLAPGARLEWLPLESLCYSGCLASNLLQMSLAPGAEVLGWDVVAFGLPRAGQPFLEGHLRQHTELAGSWMERGVIAAGDRLMMDGPLGLAGRRCMATLFFACGSDIARQRRDDALQLARELIDAHALSGSAGATAPTPQVLVVRVLAPLVEPAFELLKSIRDAWRPALWDLQPQRPRGWVL